MIAKGGELDGLGFKKNSLSIVFVRASPSKIEHSAVGIDGHHSSTLLEPFQDFRGRIASTARDIDDGSLGSIRNLS
jgi:hypothetical protein